MQYPCRAPGENSIFPFLASDFIQQKSPAVQHNAHTAYSRISMDAFTTTDMHDEHACTLTLIQKKRVNCRQMQEVVHGKLSERQTLRNPNLKCLVRSYATKSRTARRFLHGDWNAATGMQEHLALSECPAALCLANY
jgi:hypothetical protein